MTEIKINTPPSYINEKKLIEKETDLDNQKDLEKLVYTDNQKRDHLIGILDNMIVEDFIYQMDEAGEIYIQVNGYPNS